MKTQLMIISLIICTYAHAQQIESAPVNPNYIRFVENHPNNNAALGYIPSPLDLSIKQSPEVRSTMVFPASFDLRTTGNLTSVKNQASCGACWTFASLASTEYYWKAAGEGTFDLSEDNMNNCHDFDWEPCAGGNLYIALAYLSRGGGPVLESQDPYTGSAGTCPSSLSINKYITQGRYIAKNASTIKQALMDFGALYTCMYYDDAYYNSSNDTYYYNGTEPSNHAVTLVGWDDNKATAGGTGAWIIKNSWGASWGESGYFYVSYNDVDINDEVGFFPGYKPHQTTDVLYTYAKYGEIDDIGFGNNTAYGLIKFNASSNQIIKSIGSYIASGNSTAEIEIYDDFDGTNLSNLLGIVAPQSCSFPGYYTFDLPTPIAIMNGNDFYIKIKYITPSYNYPIPVEKAYAGYASNVTLETSKCWLSSNGNSWQAAGTGTSRLYDLCINAYASPAAAVNTDFIATQTSSCSGSISFSDVSQNSPTNWMWSFGDGNSSALQNPTHTYNSSGVYTVKLKSWNAFGTDSLIRSSYITINLLNAPVVDDDTVCQNQSAVLNASDTGPLNWYSDPNTDSLLGTGSSFTTPALSVSTTYYVQSSSSSEYGGNLQSNSNGSTFTAAVSHYLIFDCDEACKLVSVEVNASTAGNRVISLLNSSGATIDSRTLYIPIGVSRIVLNFDLPVANGLRLAGPISPNLYRNNFGVNYPYSIGSYVTINTSSAGTNPNDYYYFFYNWEILPNCTSARIPVEAIVAGPSANLSESGSVSICEGTSIEISAGAADSYLWFPNGETSSTISPTAAGSYFAQLSGSGCTIITDTVIVEVSPLAISLFSINQNGASIDFNNLSSNANSYYWNFDDGSNSTLASPNHTYSINGSYNVQLTSSNICNDSIYSMEVFIISADINNVKNTNFTIYPNPATEFIRILNTDIHEGSLLCIYNDLGQKILSKMLNTNSEIINISHLQKGHYRVIITSPNDIESLMLIVQ